MGVFWSIVLAWVTNLKLYDKYKIRIVKICKNLNYVSEGKYIDNKKVIFSKILLETELKVFRIWLNWHFDVPNIFIYIVGIYVYTVKLNLFSHTYFNNVKHSEKISKLENGYKSTNVVYTKTKGA